MVNCPGCSQALDISDVKVGASIECPKCKNITWAPEYVPRWWYRTANFIASILVAFLVGVLSSIAANYIWLKIHPESNPPVNTQKSEVKNVN